MLDRGLGRDAYYPERECRGQTLRMVRVHHHPGRHHAFDSQGKVGRLCLTSTGLIYETSLNILLLSRSHAARLKLSGHPYSSFSIFLTFLYFG